MAAYTLVNMRDLYELTGGHRLAITFDNGNISFKAFNNKDNLEQLFQNVNANSITVLLKGYAIKKTEDNLRILDPEGLES